MAVLQAIFLAYVTEQRAPLIDDALSYIFHREIIKLKNEENEHGKQLSQQDKVQKENDCRTISGDCNCVALSFESP